MERGVMYDFIVVGAGAAGCVLAARLSENPSTRVLLLEAGGSDRSTSVRIPAAFAKLFGTSRDWDDRTLPQRELGGRALRWPRGRMLGGSTSMNAQMYVRGQAADFAAWEAAGATGWGWDDVQPWFHRVEGGTVAGGTLGRSGPLSVSAQRDPSPLSAAFLEAAQQCQIPAGDPNDRSAAGVALAPVTQRDGRRCSAADAYLRPALRRRNLVVRTGTTVRRIVVRDGRAVGVEVADRSGSGDLLLARREVVLAAGAIGSPHLLLRSGIGPADHLRAVGVPVVADLPAVGANLADHLMAITVRLTDTPVSLASAESIPNLLRYLLFRRGPLTSNVAEALALTHADPPAGGPADIELVFAPVPYLDHGATRPPGHGFSVGAVLLQPRSTGTVRLQAVDPLAPPLIDPGYLTDADGHDLATLVRGVRLAHRVLDAPAFARYDACPLRPAPGEHDLIRFVRDQAETIYHPVGTCRMGAGPDSVVDPDLRVHGIEGLRVADASIFPRIIRGHPAAATMMIGERAAASLIGSVPPIVRPSATPRTAASGREVVGPW